MRSRGRDRKRDPASMAQIGCMIVNKDPGTPMKGWVNDMVVAELGADGVGRMHGELRMLDLGAQGRATIGLSEIKATATMAIPLLLLLQTGTIFRRAILTRAHSNIRAVIREVLTDVPISHLMKSAILSFGPATPRMRSVATRRSSLPRLCSFRGALSSPLACKVFSEP